MFRSHNPDRPWPTTGLTTERWMTEVTLQLVELRELIATQEHLQLKALTRTQWPESSFSRDPYPHVIKWNKHHYIEDGHHRICRWMMAGLTTALVRVYEIPEDTPPPPPPPQPR